MEEKQRQLQTEINQVKEIANTETKLKEEAINKIQVLEQEKESWQRQFQGNRLGKERSENALKKIRHGYEAELQKVSTLY